MLDCFNSWKINPEKKPDLNWNDWTEGFKDAENLDKPNYLENQYYMMGWYNSKGMQDGYKNNPRKYFPDQDCQDSYFQGYEDAKYERSCHGAK